MYFDYSNLLKILLKLGNHRISIQDQQVNGLLKTCMVSIEVFVVVII